MWRFVTQDIIALRSDTEKATDAMTMVYIIAAGCIKRREKVNSIVLLSVNGWMGSVGRVTSRQQRSRQIMHLAAMVFMQSATLKTSQQFY